VERVEGQVGERRGGGQVQPASAAAGGEASGDRQQPQALPFGLPPAGGVLGEREVCIQATRSAASATIAH
jgi:hypothetical protein